ncbi:MAG TPA: hypothetical protein VK558_12150 [Patescibacteria group bacterium]|nr:hypothetical protein [Patescibacteria group bacterium]
MTQSRFISAALATLLIVAAPCAATAGSFLVEYEDLPLAPGLSESAGGVVFDTPTGRIVDAGAEGSAATSADQVLTFYAQTLPELGWEKVGDSSYRRDNELLRIDVDGHRHPLSVRFSVVPQ